MTVIDEALVEATWQEVGAFGPMQANREMQRVGKKQHNLLAFVTTMLDELRPEATELGVYLFFVVYRIFEKARHGKLKRISRGAIANAYDRNEVLLTQLDGAHERFFERVAQREMSNQPYVVKYILEALLECNDDPDDIELSDDEIGFLFLVLKSVADALEKAKTS